MGVAEWKIKKTGAPSLYQKWEAYPDSPVLTEDYPYQFIIENTQNERPAQQWDNIPISSTGQIPSPMPTIMFPYQVILDAFGSKILLAAETPFYKNGSFITNASSVYVMQTNLNLFTAMYVAGTPFYTNWEADSVASPYQNFGFTIAQANAPIYLDNTYTTVYFSKTTSIEQDSNIVKYDGTLLYGFRNQLCGPLFSEQEMTNSLSSEYVCNGIVLNANDGFIVYKLDGGEWTELYKTDFISEISLPIFEAGIQMWQFSEANDNITTEDSGCEDVYFGKTTFGTPHVPKQLIRLQ